MRLLFFFAPVIAYLVLIFFNLDILSVSHTINIYNFMEIKLPVMIFSSIFFVLYLIILFLIFDWIGVLNNKKISKLDKEIFELKSKLYDEREDELIIFMKEQREKIDNFLKQQTIYIDKLKAENENLIVKQKAETNRILDKLGLVDKSIFDKIKESFKSNK